MVVYAYLQGELGIKVKLFMVKKENKIKKVVELFLLQAKLPNSVWIRGDILEDTFNLLSGDLVKGRFRFKVEFGSKECEFINNTL
jgi:hypothetical protein